MFDLLNKLRQKPEPVRRRILITSTIILTAFIFFIWLATFDLVILNNGGDEPDDSADTSSTTKNTGGVFSSFEAEFDTMRNTVFGTKFEYERGQ
ncbi:MAG: hypothetical protein COW88_03075 [Candidatus Lloydbacteria bacterium CG22_combo_CG10-13_8_21_14_all_47_15]|uniref:Uncharacterized protein n=1 Tax=Candidatus Lloydbacteria bacterium CG22_combo_CG10-13_8_21_14_all_47_15 TaxID=1974635 RepID=A0A2H0CUL7_9BACT|nr:MAG: hypothetical protein COW88_03075 [Candidatus Lloydbacteria bacterium CG22_combo_CG10-13_8_21_14_all_47_15]